MANIYELTTTFEYLQQLLLEADPDAEEQLQAALEIAEAEIEAKAEGYAYIIKNLEGDIAGFKAEEKRLAEKRRTAENAIDRLKGNLYEAMNRTGKTKFKSGTFTFAIQKNGGALPVLVDADVTEIPDDLCKITREPDKKALAAYIEETGDVSYAHFGERGTSLRIK